jgi:hypothetical protein
MSTSNPPKKLLDQARDILRLKHYSIHTEESCLTWIKRYILYHRKRHPHEMGSPEIEAFLTYLAAAPTRTSSNLKLAGLISSKLSTSKPNVPPLNVASLKVSTCWPLM